ncbi:MAG: hypothetical protein PVSMB1_18420 [Gemmatimonadaceae bacterium]
MTRLTQALRRAGVTQNESPRDVPVGVTVDTRFDAPGETGAVADAPQRSMRLPAATGTEASQDEPAATRITTLTRCPRCARVLRARSHAPGFWERRVLSLIRIRPYHCDFCGYKFHRFNVKSGDTVTDQNAVKVFSTFLPAADTRDFKELIRDIAQAEREQQSSRGLDVYPVQKRPH